MEWKETARWIKFEENVEDSNRWGKPHVASLTFHSLLELRKGLEKGMRTGDYLLGLWIVTSSVTFIKSANQSSIKLCLIVHLVAMWTLIYFIGDYFSSLFMLYEVNSSRRENQLYPSRDKRRNLLISSCMNQTLRSQVEPFNSQIKFVILINVNHTILIILVQRI